MTLDACTMPSPVGPLTLLAHGDALVTVIFADRDDRVTLHSRQMTRALGAYEARPHSDPAGAVTRLKRYFAGDVAAIDEQPVELLGTEFQKRVWNALRGIPAGTTWTYTQLADHIGARAAVRAVGAANGANPVALIVPCHRVIAANGTLWGYGGGLERKRWLLAHEGAPFVDRFGQAELELGGAG